MEKSTKTNENNAETPKIVTRAEKRDAVKGVIKEVLKEGSFKSNELIDEAAKRYADRFKGEENENPNDVKGRVGSVLDVMKKEGEVQFEGGVYATNAEKPEEKPAPKKRATKKKGSEEAAQADVKTEEKPAPKKRATKKKASEEAAQAEAKTEEKPAPKKRGRKAKTEEEKTAEALENKGEEAVSEAVLTAETPKAEEKIAESLENKGAQPIQEKTVPEKSETEEKIAVSLENKGVQPIQEKSENLPVSSPKGTLMDMSFLFGDVKPIKKEEPKAVSAETKTPPPAEKKPEQKPEQKSAPKAEKSETKAEQRAEQKPEQKKPQPKAEVKKPQAQASRRGGRALTADEKLQEAFLNRLHRLGGEYFEYYSVYLLERYSRMNGRRLEALKITGGDRDGGIDGEIELTDRLGFRETIYIQAKNWDPDKGDEKLWVVGETLLQQFIGACVCRQAKDGKQNCRGIFITTSRFTPEAKRILDDTSDKFVGYDGAELYETAKECGFGIVKKNGEWALDEQLLSGTKAFFNMA